ncbi:MAG TPA: shufflon system plasmid conjugative transfer pilus tip adhesin PilV, partial [Rhodospirillaceae bacterium]|nr:shufflon system plasmid conjugative transfer pilus tip adhesin PilV [Rhodospirillaceae bacterium]
PDSQTQTGSSDSLTVSDLINGGYLPANFSAANSFQQIPQVLFRRILPNGIVCNLQQPTPTCQTLMEAVIVTSGGQYLDQAHASHIAALIGANAGIVTDSGTATGIFGSWCIDFNLFGGAQSGNCRNHDGRASQSQAIPQSGLMPSSGHLAVALFFNGGVLMSEYLDRFATGNAEDNSMHTNLNMAGNNISEAQLINSQQINVANWVQIGGVTLQSQNQTLTLQGPKDANGIPAPAVLTADSIYAQSYFQSSDARLKTNARRLVDALPLIEKINGYRYNWKNSGQADIGFIAQQLKPILPEAVSQKPDGTLAVKYDLLNALEVEAIKDLNHKLQGIEARLNSEGEANFTIRPQNP